MPPIAYLSRKESFSAAHRLHNPLLSDEENKLIYGKCNNPNGHGHNYEVEVIVRGEIDEKTGMVINLTELKEIMHKHIIEPLDHKHLDKDLKYFETHPSTTENIAVYIWNQIVPFLRNGLLYEVKINETNRNAIIYRGE